MSINDRIDDILESGRVFLSDKKPSQWFEERMIMPPGSAFPGPWSFELTPYAVEILNRFAADDPAKKIAIMKGSQIGLSAGVLRPAIAYIISENPGNILFLVGKEELVLPGMLKLDEVIDNCGIRKLIRPIVQRMKNSRTGDTNKSKEFYGGTLIGDHVNNHNVGAQLDIMVLIIDDFDMGKMSSKTDGDTTTLFEGRTKAYEHKSKTAYVSTPRNKLSSNIYPAFLKGDQRYFNVPCPHCKDPIPYLWRTNIKGDKRRVAGMYWRTHPKTHELIEDSVCYICQLCGKEFDDSDKFERNKQGIWVPTTKPKEPGFFSYSISSLYAPPGMKGWKGYVRQYLEANPIEGKRHEAKHQVFVNTVEGLPYEAEGDSLKVTEMMKHNIRDYEAGTVPEDLSKKDGNGEIVMLTCAIDLNGVHGKEDRADDARLDYEVIAWAASGSTYSISHGSIGTYISRETPEEKKISREKWSYNHTKSNNVWKELDKVLAAEWPVAGSNRKMKIMITAMDTGYCEKEAYEYIDKNKFFIVGVKGNPEDKLKPLDRETKNYKPGASRPAGQLYILDGHNIKENLAALMRMKWSERSGESQPTGFMNYPGTGLSVEQHGRVVTLYQYNNFFSHYEAEHKVEDEKDGVVKGFVWKKKNATVQNHFWDCRYYNIAAKEILVDLFFQELKQKYYTWSDFVKLNLGK